MDIFILGEGLKLLHSAYRRLWSVAIVRILKGSYDPQKSFKTDFFIFTHNDLQSSFFARC